MRTYVAYQEVGGGGGVRNVSFSENFSPVLNGWSQILNQMILFCGKYTKDWPCDL